MIYYLYAVPEKPIEALSLSDYNHLREILGLSPVVMGKNEFLVHCDTWNYMDGIRQGLYWLQGISILIMNKGGTYGKNLCIVGNRP